MTWRDASPRRMVLISFYRDWLIQLKNHGRPRDILVPKYEGDGWLVPCRSPHPGSFGSNGVCIFYLYLFLKVSNVSITSIDGRATRI